MPEGDKMIGGSQATKALRGEDCSVAEAHEELDFAATMKRLESIVKSLEGGTLSLEESLKGFEEGIRLARYLESILDRAEKKVQEILNPPEMDSEKDSHAGVSDSEEC